ncbi:SRPBCC domain-containing protein [candidate division KSB1 bacterium]|nr:SRPBCC domain-containing protein [candidate division KSB1 bacterium]
MTEPEFVIKRVFDAPREWVYKAWTEPDRLARWWGPRGFSIMRAQLDLRPGGVFHYGLVSQTGQEMWGRFLFREIVPNERLEYISSFSDAAGRVMRYPGHEEWPLEILSIVMFRDTNGGTMLTLNATPWQASEAEQKVFEAGFKSMEGGFGGTFDQLDAYLSSTMKEHRS